MINYDDLETFRNTPPEDKLKIMSIELVRIIAILRGYTELIQKHIESKESAPAKSDIAPWLEMISEASKNLEQLRNSLL